MTDTVLVLPGSSRREEPADYRSSDNQMANLINDKAWQCLGITSQEFTRAWYAGEYTGSTDPYVIALDTLMRTGRWVAPGSTGQQ
jgi:hypothetical protein